MHKRAKVHGGRARSSRRCLPLALLMLAICLGHIMGFSNRQLFGRSSVGSAFSGGGSLSLSTSIPWRRRSSRSSPNLPTFGTTSGVAARRGSTSQATAAASRCYRHERGLQLSSPGNGTLGAMFTVKLTFTMWNSLPSSISGMRTI